MDRPIQAVQGMLVVTLAEGRVLGPVQKVFLNPARKQVSGITVREAGFGDAESWIDIGDIPQLGEHVLFVKRATACKAKDPVGRNLKNLLGTQVTTTEGRILGSLVDLDIDAKWRVVAIHLSDGRAVGFDPKQATFGQDAILLKTSAYLQEKEGAETRPGLLARIFGAETVGEAAGAIARVERSAKQIVPAAEDPDSDPQLPIPS